MLADARVPSERLVPQMMNRTVKSARCRNEPWPRGAVPVATGLIPSA
jgi:hypothetical protein